MHSLLLLSLLMTVAGTPAASDDPCHSRKRTVKVESDPSGNARFDLDIMTRAVLPSGMTLCVLQLTPSGPGKLATVTYGVHSSNRDAQVTADKAKPTLFGGLAVVAEVTHEMEIAHFTVRSAADYCGELPQLGTRNECRRTLCATDTFSMSCRDWERQKKADHTGPVQTLTMKYDTAYLDETNAQLLPVVELAALSRDNWMPKETTFYSEGKPVKTCGDLKEQDDPCVYRIDLRVGARDMKVTSTDLMGNVSTLPLPFATERKTIVGLVHKVRTQWVASLWSVDAGSFEIPLGPAENDTAPGGCAESVPCEIVGEFLRYQILGMPGVKGPQAFLKQLLTVRAVPDGEVAAPPIVLKPVYRCQANDKGENAFHSIREDSGGSGYTCTHVFSLSADARVGTKLLTACMAAPMGEHDYFDSLDPACEGRQRSFDLGYISEKPSKWAKNPLYLCYGGGRHMMALHTTTIDVHECDGQKIVATLGYVAAQ